MKLHIDTSSREKIMLKIDEKTFESSATSDKSQALLPFIERCLSKNEFTLQNVSSISVATGPGSFTGLRVGVSVSQALGWGLQIPVNGIDFNQEKYIEIHY